jgi:hypothetical protein
LPRSRAYAWGSATVELTFGGFQLCPFALPAEPFRFPLCAGVELGALEASGEVDEEGGQSRNEVEFWAAGTGALRAEWLIGRNLQVDLQTAAVFPFTRYEYALVEPQTDAGEVPWVEAAFTLGVLARLP